ncbi:MAG TPA: nuclear transport factor 2 family protein [Thermoanaerobaculia bacterium]
MSEKVIREAIQAFNKGDGGALGKMFGGGLGKNAAKATDAVRKDLGDLTYDLEHVHAEGDQVHFSYTAKGSAGGGKAATWTGSGVATVKDGKIVGLQTYEDAIRRDIQLGRLKGRLTANPSMTGNWSGSAQGITVTLQLVQSGNNVTGTANAFGATFPVTGTNNYPTVNLAGNMNGVQVTFSGSFASPNSIPGTLTALGSSIQVTINRQ